MFILVLLLILNGHTVDARVVGRTPDDSAATLEKCKAKGAELVDGLGAPPAGATVEVRCVHVDAPPAAADDSEL